MNHGCHRPDALSLPAALVLALAAALFVSLAPGNARGVSNRLPTDDEIGYLPKDGQCVAVNPPPFAWLQEPGATTYTLQIATDPTCQATVCHRDDIRYLLYTPTETLRPGRYFWRYRYTTGAGEPSDWSRTRSFTVADGTPQFPRPEWDAMVKAVPAGHPRMFMRPETSGALRASLRRPDTLAMITKWADEALSVPLMKEPAPFAGGSAETDPEAWMRYLRQITDTEPAMEKLALAWFVTQDARYADAARRHLMNFMAWDVRGASSMSVDDEVGMPILYGASRVYSWMYGVLSEEERSRVRSVMRDRGNEALGVLLHGPYEQTAYVSHSGRLWHLLGEAGVSFLGEIPEARQWLEYAVTIFYGWYPVWGDSDGGWAEGIYYWAGYNEKAAWWLGLMRSVLLVDGTRKPFYANFGEFPLHAAPPGGVLGGFGDFSEFTPPAGRGRVVAALAAARGNGVWQWYADRIGQGDGGGAVGLICSAGKSPAATPPRENNLMKLFRGIGWAVYNTSLTDPQSNIQLMHRCSAYGNISHCHNDQNGIVLSAHGVPLLVGTGTRDFYGSAYCKEYYWATRAHNCVLLDGAGQGRGPHATGSMAASGSSPGFAWAMGDATPAYEARASRCRRWTAFAREGVVLLLDEIQTTATRVELLFHARSPFRVAQQDGRFELETTTASLQAIVMGPAMPSFTQTDKTPVQPMSGTRVRPEWHLSALFDGPGAGRQLLVVTVLLPFRTGSPPDTKDWRVENGDTVTGVSWTSSRGNRTVSFDRDKAFVSSVSEQ